MKPDTAANKTVRDVLEQKHVSDTAHYRDQVKSILTTFEEYSKCDLKVTVCGSTSAGKSAVINALLGRKVLPSKSGVVTMSVLCVKGIDEEVGYIRHNDDRICIQSTDDLKKAKEIMEGKDNIVEIYWPKSECVVLKDKVMMIDSPGVGYSPVLDGFIDTNCQDSDAFVLVISYEKEIAMDDKEFLRKVKDNWSKPTMFILINKWDQTVQYGDEDEDEEDAETQEEVREKNLKSCVKFLADDLGVCDRTKAKDHIFFVSAKERLCIRRKKQAGKELTVGVTLKKCFEERDSEFLSFERKLEDRLTRGATQTKCGPRTAEGMSILKNLCKIMDSISAAATEQKDRTKEDKIREEDSLKRKTEQLKCMNEQNDKTVKEKAKQEVEKTVKKAFGDGLKKAENAVTYTELPETSNPEMCAKLNRSVARVNTIHKDFTDGVDEYMRDEIKLMRANFAKSEIEPEDDSWRPRQKPNLTRMKSFSIDDIKGQGLSAWHYVLMGGTILLGAGAVVVTGGAALAAGVSAVALHTGAAVGTAAVASGAIMAAPAIELQERESVKLFKHDYIDKLKENMEERCRNHTRDEITRAQYVLDDCRQHIEHMGEVAMKTLAGKITKLDNKIAELDKVEQKTRTYKKSAAELLKKLDAFAKEYNLELAV